MVFELNGLGSDASSASCGFKTMTRDFLFPNYILLLEQLDKAATSPLAHRLVHTAGSGRAHPRPFHSLVPVQKETTLKRNGEIGLSLGPV